MKTPAEEDAGEHPVDDPTFYDLTLYVSGASHKSAQAIASAMAVCERLLAGQHRLAILDLNHDPGAALAKHVIATPTLVRNLPLPVRKLTGDLSDADRVLSALDLPGGRPRDSPHDHTPFERPR